MTWFTDELRERASELGDEHGNEWVSDTQTLITRSAFLLDVVPHAPECAHGAVDAATGLWERCTCWKKEMQ